MHHAFAMHNALEELDAELLEQVRRVVSADGAAVNREETLQVLQRLLTPAVCRRLGLYPIPDGFLLSVVIPVYNEVNTIEQVVQRVRDVPLPTEIIMVDDGSSDGTRNVLQTFHGQPHTEIVLHDENRGKGAAIRTGLARVRGNVAIIQDADLEYDPSEFPLLLLPILEGSADVVYGSRFSAPDRRVPKYWHSTINRLLTLLSNMSTNLKLTDVETCYKMIRREVLDNVLPTLREDGFGIEIELTAKLAKVSGIRFHESPISYLPRSRKEGKKIHWRDGLRALWCILKY